MKKSIHLVILTLTVVALASFTTLHTEKPLIFYSDSNHYIELKHFNGKEKYEGYARFQANTYSGQTMPPILVETVPL